jgi:dTDP-4-dehydrorhamnose reductase
MSLPEPIAVTGASGRLGRALLSHLKELGCEAMGWGRPDYDLDDELAPGRMVERDRPGLVIHAAAWTNVDACAAEPELALRRNGEAVGELALAAAAAGAAMAVISTNEVFDGGRSDGRGYRETDPPSPPNPYGRSKLAGETAAREAFDRAGRPEALWIVRTSWLFGPPGGDFPTKILAAADRLPQPEALSVVQDERGSPTYTVDLAEAIVRLIEATPAGTYHLVNSGHCTRFQWAKRLLARCRPERLVRPISRAEFARPSQPPAWGVLDSGAAASRGVSLRAWEQASDLYAESLCPA